jgi:hypothetical protein
LVALVAIAGLAGVAWALRGRAPAAQVAVPAYQPPAPRPPELLKKLPVGMSGCLAAACHGAPATRTLEGRIDAATWQSSGSCWVAADPHANAYAVLESPLARRIMANYAKHSPGKKATEDARCVACHTNPALARPELMGDTHARQLRAEGVGCESCHGNAGKWQSEHTTWRGPRDKLYEQGGMVRLYDLGVRAATCAGCHVGAPADPGRGLPVRDMNHDMIAAGHPRLDFEFAEFIRRLPRHWQEKDRSTEPNSPRAVNPVKEWYVGRVAHAEAACRLLADRAGRSIDEQKFLEGMTAPQRQKYGFEESPWPEFAEFNCAACHHELRASGEQEKYPNWRRTAAYLGDRPPGSIPWQVIWPLTNAPGIDEPTRRDSAAWPVLDAMEKTRPARAATVLPVARQTAEKLRAKRVALVAMPDGQVEGEARAFFPTRPMAVPEWDAARQLFFGLAALDRAARPGDELLANYRRGVEAFRKKDWPGVERAFGAIRPRK